MATSALTPIQKIPTLQSSLALTQSQRGERDWMRIASGMSAIAKPTFALAALYCGADAAGFVTTSNAVPKMLKLYLDGSLTSAISSLMFGASAYAVHIYSKQFDDKFNKMLSDNIYKELKGYEYKDIPAHKKYAGKVAVEAAKHAGRIFKHKATEPFRKLGVFGAKLTVDRFITEQNNKLSAKWDPHFGEDDSYAKALFVSHLLGELENDQGLVAQRLREEPLFQSDEIKAFMQDSGKFVKAMGSNFPEIGDIGKMLMSAMGPDARFVLKDLDEYGKGKESFFALQTDILDKATKRSQIEGLQREYAVRVVHTLMRVSRGEFTPESADKEKERFKAFDDLKGMMEKEDVLFRLAEQSAKMIKMIEKRAAGNQDGGLSTNKVNQLLSSKNIRQTPIDFANLSKGSQEYESAVDAVMRLYGGKGVSAHKSFHDHYVSAALSTIESKVLERANSDFDPVKMLDYSKSKLRAHIEEYGLKSTDSLVPNDVASKVMERIKGRIYFEMYKPQITRTMEDAGLDYAP